VTWLERGDCCKRNANQFYSMIQSSNSHVRRLLTEKMQYEEELSRAKELTKQRMHGLIMQCECTFRLFFFTSGPLSNENTAQRGCQLRVFLSIPFSERFDAHFQAQVLSF
jgi:hypothetical protein